MNRHILRIVSIFSFIALAISSHAGDLPEGVEKIRSIEGITEYRLQNGLQVLLFPDPTKETATVNITYKVGSKHENYGETGMAHLLEHLVFKGTPRHPDIPKELTEHGARPNGTTWFDRTNYYETFNATDENLNWALDLEADRMVNSFIAKKDLDSEMTVVRNEFERGENSPIRVMMKRIQATAFLWHNYGKSTIGAKADLENVPIDRLKAFYERYYQPDNAVLVVAGKIDEDKTIKLVDKYFSPIPKPTRVLPATYTRDPVQDGERTVTIRRKGDVQVVAAAYHIPSAAHEEYPAIEVLTHILGDTPTGRLHKKLVETKMANVVFNMNYETAEPGLSMFIARLRKEGDLMGVRTAMLDVLESIESEPITDEEVDKAKEAILKDFQLAMNDSQTIGLGLSEYVARGDWRLLFLHRDRIEKVTKDDVLAAAKKYLVRDNRTTGYYIPEENPVRAEIPEVTNLEEILADYKGREAVAQGEAFDPSPENIEKRTERTTLANGLKVALLPKKTRGESVVANMRFHFGDEKSLWNKDIAGMFAGNMLMRGSTEMSREEIAKAFDALKAQVRVSGSATSASVRIETVREHLPATIDLVSEILRKPAFKDEELAKLKEEMIARTEGSSSDPMSIAFRESSRIFSSFEKGHPLYEYTTEEELNAFKAVTIDQVRDFYKNFYGVAQAEAVVVGDFDPATIKDKLQSSFAGWKSKQSFTRIPVHFQAVDAKPHEFETPDKANAIFIGKQPVKISRDSDDYIALTVGNYILGGGFLNSRLASRLRQKEGLSYTAAAFLSVPQFDDNANITSMAICAPENMSKLESAWREEIERFVAEGITQEELDIARKGMLQQRRVSRSEDSRLSGTLLMKLYKGEDMMRDAAMDKQIENLTVAQVNKAIKKHVSLDKMSTFKAGDLKKDQTN